MPVLSVILVEPLYQGNIGAVARAMMNFGVKDLRIVGHITIEEEARKRAVHAQDILNNAQFFGNIKDAIDDLTLIAGTTGIAPGNEKRHIRSHLELEDFAENIVGFDDAVGLVFGREDLGLLNTELEHCDIIVTIPTSDEYPVMNLSHAVSAVLYHIYILERKQEPGVRKIREATAHETELLFNRIRTLLKRIEYPDHKIDNTSIMLRRMLGRSFVSKWEYHTLMGILSRIERSLDMNSE